LLKCKIAEFINAPFFEDHSSTLNKEPIPFICGCFEPEVINAAFFVDYLMNRQNQRNATTSKIRPQV
jgi:hypothetical protein